LRKYPLWHGALVKPGILPYQDIRSRAHTTRGLNFDHKIKASAHKGDMRIGKTPKKLAFVALNAEKLKQIP
jgi:hypothetical protein